MPAHEAPSVELGSAPRTPSAAPSPSPSEISSTSSPESHDIQPTPLFRVLAMPPPDPLQPQGQEELERRLPGYRRIVIPRELTLIELLKQCSGATTDEEVLRIREAKLRVLAERVGLRRLHVLAPRLRSLILDGSAISSLRDLGIGLVHLKILSVNKCGLTSLDGVWGLSSLRELRAVGNRLEDLQPLAALQKLHTLNIADNPIADSSRLWMLAVCGSLRRLTLSGTAASDEPDYRASVASALPSLNYLDDRPLHTDIEADEFEDLGEPSSSDSEAEAEAELATCAPAQDLPDDSTPGPSTSKEALEVEKKASSDDDNIQELEQRIDVERGPKLKKLHRRRPATTEGAGVRPARPALPPRPKTAHERPCIDGPTRLQILNTLMDEEWRSSGSKLTSHGTVCGNFAQALRRPIIARQNRGLGASGAPKFTEHLQFRGKTKTGIWVNDLDIVLKPAEREAQRQLIESGVDIVTRALAEEIPRVPKLDDWARFKEETGIDIDIDFTQRPKGCDAESAIDRLDRIEKETAARLSHPGTFHEDYSVADRAAFQSVDFELWKMENTAPMSDGVAVNNIESLFQNIGLVTSPEESLPD